MNISGTIALIMLSTGNISVKPELIYDFGSIRIKSSAETFLARYDSDVFGFSPDKIVYRVSADIDLSDVNIEIGERCDHLLDRFEYTDVVNSHYMKIERFNKQPGK
jgi:hypothetical protein